MKSFTKTLWRLHDEDKFNYIDAASYYDERKKAKDLYNQDDDHQELANYYVTASYREKVTQTAHSTHTTGLSVFMQ